MARIGRGVPPQAFNAAGSIYGPRDPALDTFPLAVVTTPGQLTIVRSLVSGRTRSQAVKQFPLQGWEGWQTPAEPAIPTLDNFNRSDATPARGSWVPYATETGLAIVSNTIQPVIAVGDAACWNVAAFPADVAVKIDYAVLGNICGVLARASGPGSSLNGYYGAVSGNGVNGMRISKFVNAVETVLVQGSYTSGSGDSGVFKCVGNVLTLTVYRSDGSIRTSITVNDSTFLNGGYVGIRFASNAQALDNFGAVAYSQTVVPTVARLLGPRPPALEFPPPASPLVTTLSSALATRSGRVRTERQRAPKSFLLPPAVTLAQPPPAALGPKVSFTRRRFIPPPGGQVAAPLAIRELPSQLVETIQTNLVAVRGAAPKFVRHVLSAPVAASTTFTASPIQVSFTDDRVRSFGRRHFPSSFLYQPQTLAVFAAGRPALVKTRPRRTLAFGIQPAVVFAAPLAKAISVTLVRTRPRPTSKRLALPTVIAPILWPIHVSSVAISNRQERLRRGSRSFGIQPVVIFAAALARPSLTKLVQTRPSKTTRTLSAAIVVSTAAPVDTTIAVALVRSRPQRTSSFIARPTALRIFSSFGTHLVNARPRSTSKFLADPTVVRVPSVEQAEQTVRVSLAVARPRATRRFLGRPTALQTFSIGLTKLVQIRPRLTVHRVELPIVLRVPSVEQAEDTVRVALTHTRPRQVIRSLGRPTALQIFQGPKVSLVVTRPRATTHRVELPIVLRVPSVEQSEDTIKTFLVRTRPRPTVRVLSKPTATQTFAGPAVHLVNARPRPTIKLIGEPQVIRVPSVEQAEQTIRTSLAKIRPRPTARRLVGPIVLQVFQAAKVTLTRIRPRHTLYHVELPTVLRVPAVEQQEDTIRTAFARTRPRPTRTALAGPTSLAIFAGSKTTLARTRPRRTLYKVELPSVLRVPSVEQAEDTIKLTLVRTRPRQTVWHLNGPTALLVFAGPTVALVHTRPRATTRFLAEPTVVRVPSVEQQEDTIKTSLVRIKPRHTISLLGGPSGFQTFEGANAPLVQTRPRQTTRFLGEPTVVIPLPSLAAQTVSTALTNARPPKTEVRIEPPTVLSTAAPPTLEQQTPKTKLVAVRTKTEQRLHGTHYLLRGPQAVIPLPTLRVETLAISLARIRPRQITARLSGPATLRLAVTKNLLKLVQTRPRPIGSNLGSPAALQVFQGPKVKLAAIRPRLTLHRVGLPTVLRVPSVEQAEDTIKASLARIRPRQTRWHLGAPTVLRVFAGPVVALARIRPRPTTKALADPTVVRVPSIEQQEDTIKVALVHTRPRATVAQLAPPVSLRVFQAAKVSLVRTRPRPTSKRLELPTLVRIPSVEQAEDTIRVSLARTRPRVASASLGGPQATEVFSFGISKLVGARPAKTSSQLFRLADRQAFSTGRPQLVSLRPARTTSFLSPPTVLIRQTFYTGTPTTVVTRPPKTSSSLGLPQALQIFSGPEVSLATIRPPKTTSSLLGVLVAFVQEQTVRVSLTVTRPRGVSSSLPLVLVAAVAEQTIRVTSVGTRPRATSSFLSAPAIIKAAAEYPFGPTILIRTRPRKTVPFLLPPTAVEIPAVKQAQETIQVAFVQARPRPTIGLILPPSVVAETERAVVTTSASHPVIGATSESEGAEATTSSSSPDTIADVSSTGLAEGTVSETEGAEAETEAN